MEFGFLNNDSLLNRRLSYYLEENDVDIYTLIQCKMNRDKIDALLLSTVSSTLKRHTFETNRINVLLYNNIAASYNTFRAQCIQQRHAFSLCLQILCPIKDLRRLLLQYLIDTEDYAQRLDDTIRFCCRQFVHEKWRRPIDWFVHAKLCSQELSRLFENVTDLQIPPHFFRSWS